MAESEKLEVALERWCEALHSYADTFEQAPGETLRSTEVPTDDTLVESGKLLLDAADPDLTLGDTLGEGGMGVVRIATQAALGRRVAVKSLRPELRSSGSTRKLLHEARITGSLEHPNVVPVHTIEVDEDGSPLIVLKHIHGVHWGVLIDDPETVTRRFGARDPLEWHLQVLLQVCNAVHFAHRRGIVHRDLKPENVMIGEFGEVYVLDWGLALRVPAPRPPRDEGSPRLVGTPSYMAPEMVSADASAVTPRTDVYLLGGILHEIVTGHPPHRGTGMPELLRSILTSHVELGDDVPRELADVVRRALAPDPDDRFEDVEALRTAIEGFLHHRGSIQLAEEADRRLEELRGHVAQEVEDADDAGRALRAFAECRFGYHQALRAWPGNERARRGLARAYALMVERELAEGDPRGASHLLGEMSEPPPDLVARVDEALGAWKARQKKLGRIEREFDPRGGRRVRLWLAGAVGLFWTVSPLVATTSHVGYATTHFSLMTLPALLLVAVPALAFVFRKSFLSTPFNRKLLWALVLSQLGEISLYLASHWAGLSVVQSQVMMPFLGACFTAVLALTLARPFAAASVAYTAAFLVASAHPDWRYYTESAANLALTVTVLVVWWGTGETPRGPPRPPAER